MENGSTSLFLLQSATELTSIRTQLMSLYNVDDGSVISRGRIEHDPVSLAHTTAAITSNFVSSSTDLLGLSYSTGKIALFVPARKN